MKIRMPGEVYKDDIIDLNDIYIKMSEVSEIVSIGNGESSEKDGSEKSDLDFNPAHNLL